MYKQDIAQLVFRNDTAARMFRGFCALDEVYQLQDRGYVFLNTQRRAQEGGHWLLYMKTQEDRFVNFAPMVYPRRTPIATAYCGRIQ